MIRFYWMLVFIGLSANAQQLELKIDSISIDDSDSTERVFNLHYHLENLTNERLRFFLNTSNIVSSTGGSSTMYPFYKLYEEDSFLEVGNVFSGSSRKAYNLEKINLDSLLTAINQKRDVVVVVEIAPKEVKRFMMDFQWDHNRYYQNHDMEYYLEEKARHFLEITIVLQKEIYKSKIPETFFNEIMEDKRFIQGAFTSNKYPIDFGKRK